MALAEIFTRHTGKRITALWHAGYVVVYLPGEDWFLNAFALADEAPLALAEDGAGTLWLTYLDADETPVRHYSGDGGYTWSLLEE